MTRFLAILIATLGTMIPALAQMSVKLDVPRNNYLAGEPIRVKLTISNLSGQDVTFRGTPEQPWLDFIVGTTRNVPLAPAVKPVFGVSTVPSGKAISKVIDLAQIYSFSDLGNFSVYAVVRPDASRTQGYQSKRHLFNVTSAAPYWTRDVGVNGRIHEYRMIHFKANRKSQLYIQVADKKTDRIIRTHNLGEMLMVRKPTATIDDSLNMHVLYMINPGFWGHARVAPEGHFIGRDIYQPGQVTVPQLGKTSDGAIKVVGGIFYDPEKEAAARNKIPKATDRPDNFLD